MNEYECNHNFVSNSGKGGEPIFKMNRQLSNKLLMHVTCSLCNARTWLNEAQWNIFQKAKQ